MKFKSALVAGALLLAPHTISDSIKKYTQEELYTYIAYQEKIKEEKRAPVYFHFELSQELIYQIDTMCLDVNCPVVFSRSREDLRNTPLVMRGTKRHIGEYLGYDQYDYILKTYNADSIPDSTKTYDALRIDNIKNIQFPLIYDAIGKAVPHTLHALFQDERFATYRDTIHDKDTLIVSMEVEAKRALLFYKTGELVLATQSSIGRGKSTPRGLFRVDYTIKDKRSVKHRDAPMPYAIHVTGHIFAHQGKVSTSTRSLGCIRIPGVYAETLFYMIQSPSRKQLYVVSKNPKDSLLRQEMDSLQQLTPKVLIVD